MEPMKFKALQSNRVKLINLDYFDLTAPLLAKEILPTKIHKEIKNEGKSDKARVDSLLEWIEECSHAAAFSTFIEGVRNCKQGGLAKKLKRDSEGDHPVQIKKEPGEKPKLLKTPKTPKTPNGLKKTPKGPKILDMEKSFASFLNPNTSIKIEPQDIKKEDAKKGAKRKSVSAPSTPAGASEPAKKKQKVKPATTPATKSAPAIAIKKDKVEKEGKKQEKSKSMSFEEVLEKQKNARQVFKFTNNAAVFKEIPAGNIYIEGCALKNSNGFCAKKVEPMGKEYICKEAHKCPNFIQVPRLNAILTDGTADLHATFYKSSVEQILNKNGSELIKMDQNALKNYLDQYVGKNFNLEVECTKIEKKEAKRLGGKKWDNVATVLKDDSPMTPSQGKKKK